MPHFWLSVGVLRQVPLVADQGVRPVDEVEVDVVGSLIVFLI